MNMIKNVKNDVANNLGNLPAVGFNLTVHRAANRTSTVVPIINVSEIQVLKGRFGNMGSNSPPITPQQRAVV